MSVEKYIYIVHGGPILRRCSRIGLSCKPISALRKKMQSYYPKCLVDVYPVIGAERVYEIFMGYCGDSSGFVKGWFGRTRIMLDSAMAEYMEELEKKGEVKKEWVKKEEVKKDVISRTIEEEIDELLCLSCAGKGNPSVNDTTDSEQLPTPLPSTAPTLPPRPAVKPEERAEITIKLYPYQEYEAYDETPKTEACNPYSYY